MQAVRPTVLRAYANGAVTSQQSSSEVDIKQGWDELQANASTSEGRKELADLRRIVADLTKTPDEVLNRSCKALGPRIYYMNVVSNVLEDLKLQNFD